MRTRARSVAILVAALALAGCCKTPKDTVAAAPFQGLSGTVALFPDPCETRQCETTPGAGVVVATERDSAAVVEGVIDASGRFEIEVEAGVWELVVAPFLTEPDRDVPPLQVGRTGFDLTRHYARTLSTTDVFLTFDRSVTTPRAEEIIVEAGLTRIEWVSGTTWKVGVPSGRHPRLEGEAVAGAYPGEVAEVALDEIGCAVAQ